IYLLRSKDYALSSFQPFGQSNVIPSGSRTEWDRADKGGEYINNEYKVYCLQTGLSLEYASTNTPQEITMSERVGRTLMAMVRCLLGESGLP
ncbi:unnamed protein product, partial [Ascophyllum nodosum]